MQDLAIVRPNQLLYHHDMRDLENITPHSRSTAKDIESIAGQLPLLGREVALHTLQDRLLVFIIGPHATMQSPCTGTQEIINRHHFALDLDRVDIGIKICGGGHDIA